MISFPIYLTRILSSMLCGLITIAVLLVELHFYKIDCLWQLIVCIGNISYVVDVIFFSGVFFIGELFTGVAEIFVFDPMFSSVRKTCDTRGKLENVAGSCSRFPTWISWFFCCGLIVKDTRTIKFRDIIEFSKNDSATFALSEMYFNIHRILGGMFIFFLLLPVISLFLITFFSDQTFSCITFIILFVVNILLGKFSFTQAWKQRMFANSLIFYRPSSPAKHLTYKLRRNN